MVRCVPLLVFACSLSVSAVTLRHSPQAGLVQAVIETAQPGDVVLLAKGTYRERLVLKPGVILRGVDTKGVVIDGGGSAPVIRLGLGSELEQLTVTGGGTFDPVRFDEHHESRGEMLADGEGAAGAVSGAIELDQGSAIVRQCIVRDNGGPGIAVSGKGNQSLVEANTVFRNMGGGIGIADGAEAIVLRNECHDNLRAGIGCRASAPRIEDNRCHDNVRAGIGIREGARPLVLGNTCWNNRRAGIGVRMPKTAPLLLDNQCHGNGMAGIGSRDEAEPILVGNLCVSNRLAGIGAMADARIIAIGNTLRANGAAAIGFDTCTSGTAYLEGNDIEANKVVALGVRAGWTLLAVSNRFHRVGGMPPLVMVFEGANTDFRGNEFRSGGIAGIRCAGTAFVASNRFVRPEPGPQRNAVWGLAGSKVTIGSDNRGTGWKVPDGEGDAAPSLKSWSEHITAARARLDAHTEHLPTVRHAFLLSGDPQYLAENAAEPTRLDPYSEAANTGFLRTLRALPGRQVPAALGGGRVSTKLLGILVAGDLIDSADKQGGNYPAMQRFEWKRYLSDYGLTGRDGGLPYPVYELHGNHDGPQGDTFIVESIIERTKTRPGVVNISSNGLHYSWNWGSMHCVSLGMFAGLGDARRPDAHYAPRGSLRFLIDDLKQQVGDSGRPVLLACHLHPNAPAFDWPREDLKTFWEVAKSYNVVGILHGHTHGAPSRLQWNGRQFARQIAGGIDVFNPDDSGASKTNPRDPTRGVGLAHGVLYGELVDRPGRVLDEFVVRSLFTKDNWETDAWGERWAGRVWQKP